MKKYIKPALLILLGLVIGSVMATPEPQVKEVVKEVPTVRTVERKVEVVKTPQACKDALNLDNEIFIKVGESFENFEFAALTDYLNSVQDRRLSLVDECVRQ